MTIQAMVQKRDAIVAQMRSLNDISISEARAMTSEEQTKWDKMDADVVDFDKKITRAQRLKDLNTDLAAQADAGPQDEPQKKELRHTEVFEKYTRRGLGSLSQEEMQLMKTGELRGTATQVTTTDSLGGYLVPDQWSTEIEKTMVYYGGMLEAGRIITTSKGGPWREPTQNDTANVGAIIGQGVIDTVSDMAWGENVLNDYTYTSNLIKASWEQMNDNAYNMPSHINQAIGERIGRILNTHLTTGDGSGKPTGIATSAPEGEEGATASAILFDELIELEHSVGILYRKSPSAAFMMHDSTLKAIKKLKDQNDLYIWQGSTTSGEPSTILGYKYHINNDLDEIAADAKTVFFGDWSKYQIRRVQGVELVRLNERFADSRAVGFFGFARYDGKLANTAAIKHLKQAS